MTFSRNGLKTVLMMAYTYYESDTRVIREAEAAVDGGFEVDFLALRKEGTPGTEMVRGVRVIRVNQTKYRGSQHLRYLVEYIKFFLRCFGKTTILYFRRRYRIIHVNNMPDFMVFSTIIPTLFGSKVILDIHDPMPSTFASKFKGRERGFYYRALLWQERLSAAFSSRVITVHQLVKDRILKKDGIDPHKIEVVPNFADDRLFPLRKEFDIDGKIRFVFHGTILERAGFRVLLTSMAQMHHKEKVTLKIIGEGDFSGSLKEMIRSLKLGHIVDFDNHTYPAQLVLEQLKDCNVGLVPLEITGITNYALPTKLLEYVSLGLPVVTIRNDAISYYFSEEDCIFFEWNDASSLSSAFDRLAENPGILIRYRERSLALRERFSWAREKTKYIALLQHLGTV